MQRWTLQDTGRLSVDQMMYIVVSSTVNPFPKDQLILEFEEQPYEYHLLIFHRRLKKGFVLKSCLGV